MKNSLIKIIAFASLCFGLLTIGAVQYVLAETNRSVMVGPRGNIATSTPKAYGFWSFAVLDGGKISRSGQPLLSEFHWLKNNGWKSVVDLRVDGEYKEVSDDRKIIGFNSLKFNFLSLPIKDGGIPTFQQAQQFLQFVTDPKNQPVEIHCRGGYGRTGTLIALYRYTVDGWTMPQAIAESRLYRRGVDSRQKQWLLNWAKNHKLNTINR
jgi:protein tyrosine/serine phosphatase